MPFIWNHWVCLQVGCDVNEIWLLCMCSLLTHTTSSKMCIYITANLKSYSCTENGCLEARDQAKFLFGSSHTLWSISSLTFRVYSNRCIYGKHITDNDWRQADQIKCAEKHNHSKACLVFHIQTLFSMKTDFWFMGNKTKGL